jgi:uncharacterized membrane protein YdbT with pleckstrin-like domain
MDSQEPHQPENIIWAGRRSWWFYLGEWFGSVILATLLVAAIRYNEDQLRAWIPWIYGIPLLLVPAVILGTVVYRNRWKYQVTNRRVIAEYGWIIKDSNEIRAEDIRSITVSRKGLSSLFGVGRVEFSSAATDDADVIFYQIGGANTVRDLVRKLQN